MTKLEHLRARPNCGCELCERAAILEHDGGMTRAEAEAMAAQIRELTSRVDDLENLQQRGREAGAREERVKR